MASDGEEKTQDGAVAIYTDGGCHGNPGPGGWGAVLMYKGREREHLGRRTAYHQQPHGADGGDHGA